MLLHLPSPEDGSDIPLPKENSTIITNKRESLNGINQQILQILRSLLRLLYIKVTICLHYIKSAATDLTTSVKSSTVPKTAQQHPIVEVVGLTFR